ncbi:hypothetical protein LINGRAHAP2_LOCUS3001 [Linum grandiflorum]
MCWGRRLPLLRWLKFPALIRWESRWSALILLHEVLTLLMHILERWKLDSLLPTLIIV